MNSIGWTSWYFVHEIVTCKTIRLFSVNRSIESIRPLLFVICQPIVARCRAYPLETYVSFSSFSSFQIAMQTHVHSKLHKLIRLSETDREIIFIESVLHKIAGATAMRFIWTKAFLFLISHSCTFLICRTYSTNNTRSFIKRHNFIWIFSIPNRDFRKNKFHQWILFNPLQVFTWTQPRHSHTCAVKIINGLISIWFNLYLNFFNCINGVGAIIDMKIDAQIAIMFNYTGSIPHMNAMAPIQTSRSIHASMHGAFSLLLQKKHGDFMNLVVPLCDSNHEMRGSLCFIRTMKWVTLLDCYHPGSYVVRGSICRWEGIFKQNRLHDETEEQRFVLRA